MPRLVALALLVSLVFVAPAETSDPKLGDIDGAVAAAIERKELPGAVVVVLHKGNVVHRKAYGHMALLPQPIAMDLLALFDLASLTKPIATATALMLLVEAGKVDVKDRLSKHLPAFRRKETEDITLEHLLVHTSGFIADNPLADYQQGPKAAWEKLFALNPTTPVGTRFTYSDVNYLLLGKVVEEVSGMKLDEFTSKRIFEPLRMKETGFLPGAQLKRRAAPTQEREGRWMVGEVHDPRAYLLGGVAGHAGLFSTADDLTIYVKMLLGRGRHEAKTFLKETTVDFMTAPREVPGKAAPSKAAPGLRTYGWDMATSFSSNRGEVFPKGKSFGHTGFTGTSLWVDPASQTAVIFLSNRVHPDGKGNVTKLRGQVATIAGRALAK